MDAILFDEAKNANKINSSKSTEKFDKHSGKSFKGYCNFELLVC